jgi:hypothetical protein
MDTALNPVNPALEDFQEQQDFGTAIDAGGFSATIADTPVGLSLAEVFANVSGALPEAADLYKRFAVWLVPVRVGIVRRSGLAEVTSVGIECEFLNGKKTCCVVALMPTPQYVAWGKVGGNLKFAASLSVTGDLGTPNGGTTDVPALPSLSLVQQAGVGVMAQFSVNVLTPYISAVGIGSQHVEWRFDRHEQALFGRDIEAWAVVVLPKNQKNLEMRVRTYMTTRTAFFPTRRQSDWQQFTCRLSDGRTHP